MREAHASLFRGEVLLCGFLPVQGSTYFLKAFKNQNFMSVRPRRLVILEVLAMAARAFEPDQAPEFDRQHFDLMHIPTAHRTLQYVAIHKANKKH